MGRASYHHQEGRLEGKRRDFFRRLMLGRVLSNVFKGVLGAKEWTTDLPSARRLGKTKRDIVLGIWGTKERKSGRRVK